MVLNWRKRFAAAVAATAAFMACAGPAVHATEADGGGTKAASAQLLLVHGYGNHSKGKDCNGDIWKNALKYYQDAGGRSRASMTTIGYYTGDDKAKDYGPGCDVIVGDGEADNARPIQDIAKDFAHYIHKVNTKEGKPVDIVAHSMGGLVTRVALLGSAQGWKGFPPKLDVNNVVTLSTPHRGVEDPGKYNTRQWHQMDPESGFMDRLHAKGRELGDDWARGTDWSLVGADEDGTVSYKSGIDKGNFADQKYRYRKGGDYKLSHTTIRTYYKGKYNLQYWHASGDHDPHRTTNGWNPLKTAFKAATTKGDDLPR